MHYAVEAAVEADEAVDPSGGTALIACLITECGAQTELKVRCMCCSTGAASMRTTPASLFLSLSFAFSFSASFSHRTTPQPLPLTHTHTHTQYISTMYIYPLPYILCACSELEYIDVRNARLCGARPRGGCRVRRGRCDEGNRRLAPHAVTSRSGARPGSCCKVRWFSAHCLLFVRCWQCATACRASFPAISAISAPRGAPGVVAPSSPSAPLPSASPPRAAACLPPLSRPVYITSRSAPPSYVHVRAAPSLSTAHTSMRGTAMARRRCTTRWRKMTSSWLRYSFVGERT